MCRARPETPLERKLDLLAAAESVESPELAELGFASPHWEVSASASEVPGWSAAPANAPQESSPPAAARAMSKPALAPPPSPAAAATASAIAMTASSATPACNCWADLLNQAKSTFLNFGCGGTTIFLDTAASSEGALLLSTIEPSELSLCPAMRSMAFFIWSPPGCGKVTRRGYGGSRDRDVPSVVMYDCS